MSDLFPQGSPVANEVILIVDDEPLHAEEAKAILERSGIVSCIMAFNVEQALAAFERHRPRLVIQDVVMQGEKRGVELIEEMRRRNRVVSPGLPFALFVTGHTIDAGGFQDVSHHLWLPKPFVPTDLEDKVKEARKKILSITSPFAKRLIRLQNKN